MNTVILILVIIACVIFLSLAGMWFSEPKWTDGKRHMHYAGAFIFMWACLAGIACLLIALVCWLSQHVGFVWK